MNSDSLLRSAGEQFQQVNCSVTEHSKNAVLRCNSRVARVKKNPRNLSGDLIFWTLKTKLKR
jgi:hypothetical protein